MEYDLLSLADVSTLGNLFASDTTRKLDYGDMELTVVVPVPPAVLLGMIGLGLAGVRLRRSSKEPHGKQ